jgi:dienelactone hydrolase
MDKTVTIDSAGADMGVYHEASAQDARQRTLDWLDAHLAA